MGTPILMPALSPTMETGKLVKWHVKEGDTVRSGDVIAEIETDKATMEVEAVDEGRIGKLLVAEGTEQVPVNQPIAMLLEEGEGASSFETRPAAAPQDEERSSPHPEEGAFAPVAKGEARAHLRPSRRVRPSRSCTRSPSRSGRTTLTVTPGASSPRRSRGGSPASAASRLPRSTAQARMAAS